MKRKWTSNDIPSLQGKVAIVTGANAGIGFETAKALAIKGAHVIFACRNEQKGNNALHKIQKYKADSSVEYIHLDLSDSKSVKQFANAFSEKFKELNILINNAGVMMIPHHLKTKDGFEMQFGTNHLGHFALTGMLLKCIKNTEDSRIITVSSSGHKFGKIDFTNLNAEKEYDRANAYAQSKLANILFAYHLQKLFTKHKIKSLSVACHPGWTQTDLAKHWKTIQTLSPILGQSPAKGALPSLFAATAANVHGGEYFGPGGILEMKGFPKRVESSKISHDNELAKKLWQVSETLTKVQYFPTI